MTETQAETLAALVGGEAWQSGGGVWLVTLRTWEEKVVVFSGETVCEYNSEENFEESRPAKVIYIETGESRWVIQDDEGNVFYEHDQLELGWTDQYEAERQARYRETREGGHFFVREQ